MTTITATFEILGSEFDLDQLNDIATHGMAQGVAGFIYSSDLYDLFTEHGEKVMEYLDDKADELGVMSGLQMVVDSITKGEEVYYSVQETKEQAIWMFVEMTAHDLLIGCGHPDWV